ncbi:hypothetical protein BRYFOR_09051 [Marvinbryantia formatexigens DSM 14469]|uniref:DUF2975 domain-containing protein n=1 Tax=Marvinbryantia formatexigens DSM 14469 TaxID=478749 RepID=C6LK64_9FIRM|nr:hypothetical protein [Marvinbryantia formatexigens]EET58945.1 hypothetical protein BRYFOR_09051 [Marvinbryantia formatexigens DSM 14469]UWO23443.1 hypothetical protein NQ534_13400 [Marvinbryantia formatexigens DSM 14469]SDH19048.1 hypothetical protein SAMN05660368_03989 [Marvinbryantia formatexigens]
MRYRYFYSALALEAILCVIFALPQIQLSGVFTSIAAFPFEQIGLGLRMLSLSGTAGNLAAILLYLLLGLLPCAVYYFLRAKKRLCGADWLLIVLSVLLFVVNYYMINPGLLGAGAAGSAKWIPGGTFYAVLCGYLALRMLCMYASADAKKLQEALKLLLLFMMAVFVYGVSGQELGWLFSAIQNVQSGNSISVEVTALYGPAQELIPTYVFLVFQFLIRALPWCMDLAAAFLALRMLDALGKDRYSEEAVGAVKKLADFCRMALSVTIGAEILFHVLQFLLRERLYQMDIFIRFPVLSIVFVLAMLLAARYLQEDQRMKQEHDLFI